MRRASALVVAVGASILLIGTAVALAAPTISFTSKIVPIPGFTETGDLLGAGAAVQANYSISGTESSGGVPSQLTHVNFYLPAHTKVNDSHFTTCTTAALEANGPSGCPKGSQASPVGSAGVVDPIGGEDVREQATLQAFFTPENGLDFYVDAASPISAQIVAKGNFSTAAAPYGPKLEVEVPLVDSVPGAPDVSTTAIDVKVGAAIRKAGKTFYYGTVPSTCPKGGFPVKSEMTFESGEMVTNSYKVPCPTRSVKKKKRG